MLKLADGLHRWLAMFYLALAAGMLFWGQTLLIKSLSGILYVIYWLACLLLAAAAIVFGAVDICLLRRQHRQHRAQQFQQTLEEIRSGQTRDVANDQ